MRVLHVGDSSSCATPLLDLHVQQRGVLADVAGVAFQVWDLTGATPTQVYPATAGDRATVDVAACPVGGRVSLGRYAAGWTVPGGAAAGRWQVRWYVEVASGDPEVVVVEPFEVVPAAHLNARPIYALPADLRAEGVLASTPDARLRLALEQATAYVDRVTGWWFSPRRMTMRVDGDGGPMLLLRTPVAGLGGATLNGSLVPLAELVVYARHLSGLTSPDDRRNPKVVWPGGCWREGAQNVALEGVFGCTEDDGSGISVGVTPQLIEHVTKLIALREIEGMASDDRSWSRNAHRLVSEQTRGQSYTLAPVGGSRGSGGPVFTGDAEIDAILAAFRRPMGVSRI